MTTVKASGLLLAICGLAFGLFWIFAESPDKSNNTAEAESEQDGEIVGVDLDQVPEYLAFQTVFAAGEVLQVSDSDETEFLEDDDDNEFDSDFLSGDELTLIDDKDDDDDDDDEEEDDDFQDFESVDPDSPSRFQADLEDELEDILDEYDLDFDEVNLSTFEASTRTSLSEIGGSIDPGIYVTPVTATDCSFELTRIAEDGSVQVVGSDEITQGRLIVNINGVEPDFFYSTPGCGEWSEWSQLSEPLSAIDNGDYWIGDLVEGTWQTGDGCTWERVSDFRGAQLADIVESGNDQNNFAINESMTGVRIRNCINPSFLTDSEIPEELAFVDEVFEVSRSGRVTRR